MEPKPFHLEANNFRILTTFSSDKVTVHADAERIRAFLSNLENLVHLLPTERIEKPDLQKEKASFKIKGLAEISIALQDSSEAKVSYKNTSEKPFAFTLEVELESQGEETACQTKFHADINSFMGMMMKGPLTNFLNDLVSNLDNYFRKEG